MVHRAPDSRLLNNLIAHEKEYTKHLSALFPISHTALASLSAYITAYPSLSIPHAPSQSLAAVVDVLATADNALQRYNTAVEAWREQLALLKELEDDLGAILRDRDILVTRLIKASKSTKSTRDVRSSLMIPHGSASLSSLPSTNSSHGGTSNSKLAQAQAELQACEVHLSVKERELEARRVAVAREGLGARCRALIDCGWVWGEMGKQGLQALQALSGTHNNVSKPLPVPSPYRTNPPSVHPHSTNNLISYASDSSSLTPSQSASQTAPRSGESSLEIPRQYPGPSPERAHSRRTPSKSAEVGDVTITLPPAHAISDLAFPTGVRAQSQHIPNNGNAVGRNRSKRQRRPPSQHITEVDEHDDDDAPLPGLIPTVSVSNAFTAAATPFPVSDAHANDTTGAHESSSDDDHPQGPLEIIENDPFSKMKQRTSNTPSPTPASMNGTPRGISPTLSPQLMPPSKPRERRTSMAIFGSIRGLFRHKPKERGSVEWEEGQASPTRSKQKGSGSNGWVTRTDARLKSKGREDDSDEDVSTPVMRRASASVVSPSGHAIGSKLRKGRPGALNGSPQVDGWITDSGTTANRRESIKRKKKKSVADLRGGNQGHSDNEAERRVADTPRVNGGPLAQESTPPMTQSQSQQSAKVASSDSLARRSSSSKERGTAIPADPSPRRMTTDFSGGIGHGTASKETTTSSAPPRRSVSASASPSLPSPATLSDISTASKSKPKSHGGFTKQELHYANNTASQSLMSIVADVTRQNREGWASAPSVSESSSGATMVQVPKAPSLMAPVVAAAEHQKTRSLDMPRVPVSGVATVEGQEAVQAASGNGSGSGQSQATARAQGHGHGHYRSSSTPVVHYIVPSSSVVVNGNGANQTNARPAPKLPLRSALRNPSRTPSPSPARFAETGTGTQREDSKAEVREAPVHDAVVERGRSPSLASISSYATVRESFEDDDHEQEQEEPEEDLGQRRVVPPPRSSSLPPNGFSLALNQSSSSSRQSSPPPQQSSSPPQSPPPQQSSPTRQPPSRESSPPPRPSSPPFSFPPPPVESPPPKKATRCLSGHQEDGGSGSAPPSSTVSTDTIPRRKSVRVSLQPTFSPSPPVTYDDDDDDDAYEPRGDRKPPSASGQSLDGGWKMRNGHARVGDRLGAGVWEDSSEEDAEYARARNLLTRVVKKEKGKEREGGWGKGRGNG